VGVAAAIVAAAEESVFPTPFWAFQAMTAWFFGDKRDLDDISSVDTTIGLFKWRKKS
jgi:hypothetical protein